MFLFLPNHKGYIHFLILLLYSLLSFLVLPWTPWVQNTHFQLDSGIKAWSSFFLVSLSATTVAWSIINQITKFHLSHSTEGNRPEKEGIEMNFIKANSILPLFCSVLPLKEARPGGSYLMRCRQERWDLSIARGKRKKFFGSVFVCFFQVNLSQVYLLFSPVRNGHFSSRRKCIGLPGGWVVLICHRLLFLPFSNSHSKNYCYFSLMFLRTMMMRFLEKEDSDSEELFFWFAFVVQSWKSSSCQGPICRPRLTLPKKRFSLRHHHNINRAQPKHPTDLSCRG